MSGEGPVAKCVAAYGFWKKCACLEWLLCSVQSVFKRKMAVDCQCEEHITAHIVFLIGQWPYKSGQDLASMSGDVV